MLLAAINKSWLETPGPAYCAVSGGVDSMVLLHGLWLARKAEGRSRPLVVLHVNHGLRGAESDADEALVRRYAGELGLAVQVERISWAVGERASQAACREKRRDFFRRVLAKEEGRLFLGHHRDDQAETLLLRLLRGSGVRGLRGMAYRTGLIVRPLLFHGRDEILAAAEDWRVPWREDASNLHSKYERNWLRHEILPLLEARRPGVARRIAALAEEARMLPLPELPPGGFSPVEGITCYRQSDWALAGSGEISAEFRLSRRHAEGVVELLQRSSGAYSVPGMELRLSAGVLLANQRGRALARGHAREGGAESLVGRWRLHLGEGDRLGFAAELGLGESAKKEFQRQRVPVFFRGLVPLLVKRDGAKALLPGRWEPREEKNEALELSPLGQWWLLRR